MARKGLDKLAIEFATDLSELLNRTVCQGIRITPVTSLGRGLSWVGYGISKTNPAPELGIPMCLGDAPASCYLHASFVLQFDAEGDYIQVEKSAMGICTEPDLTGELFHYDFERNKERGYPDAHLQIPVEHPVWNELQKRRGLEKTFERIHLPLGNKRFRPTVEDLVEFCVVEGLAEARPGWESVVAEYREKFAIIQLRAAIRRNPEAAREAVEEFDGH